MEKNKTPGPKARFYKSADDILPENMKECFDETKFVTFFGRNFNLIKNRKITFDNIMCYSDGQKIDSALYLGIPFTMFLKNMGIEPNKLIPVFCTYRDKEKNKTMENKLAGISSYEDEIFDKYTFPSNKKSFMVLATILNKPLLVAMEDEYGKKYGSPIESLAKYYPKNFGFFKKLFY